jgi:hypothetical protein
VYALVEGAPRLLTSFLIDKMCSRVENCRAAQAIWPNEEIFAGVQNGAGGLPCLEFVLLPSSAEKQFQVPAHSL